MIKGKIDVTKILKEHLYRGKPGKPSKGVYLDFVAWENRSGPGTYGDTHYITQDVGQEARESGIKSEIIGNITIPETSIPAPDPVDASRSVEPAPAVTITEEDIPF